jgi:hypothetical protein
MRRSQRRIRRLAACVIPAIAVFVRIGVAPLLFGSACAKDRLEESIREETRRSWEEQLLRRHAEREGRR